MMRLKRTLLAGACLLWALPTKADNLLIWRPARVSEQSYKATMGFHLPSEWETSAGADLALASEGGGTIQTDSEQATLWGKITKVRATPAGQAEQDASVRIDTLRGSGSLLLSRSRSFILSDSLDLQTSRFVSVGFDAVETRQASVTASQALKLIAPSTGTTFSAGGSVVDFGKDFSSSLGVSQNIFPNLNLSAGMTDPLSIDRSATVNVNYRVSW